MQLNKTDFVIDSYVDVADKILYINILYTISFL